jgi:PST family polysaccharide transporter
MVSFYDELKEGWHIFLGLSAVSLYSNSNAFILGLLTNNIFVGYFTAGETLIRALDNLLSVISQAVYPHMSRLANTSKIAARAFIKKMLAILGSATFILSIIIFLSARWIADIILGPQYTNSVVVLQILAPQTFVWGINGILATQGLLAFNLNRGFSVIVSLVGLFNLALSFILVPVYKHIGSSVSLLASEFFGTIIIALYLRNKGIIMSNNPETNNDL